ncbi:MAG: ABC transporter permease [Rhodospirillales bacterium]|nr:ABC transporter permease [Rhodospirillales bacterium]
MSRFLHPGLVIGSLLVLAVLGAAIFAPLIAPFDPAQQDLLAPLAPAAWQHGGSLAHLFGTDTLGRDVLSRVIYASRAAVLVAVLAAAGAGLIGSLLALAAGYLGGWVDRLVRCAVDVWLAFPPVVLSLLLIAGLGAGVVKVVLAIALVDWVRFCDELLGGVSAAAQSERTAAARLLGFSHLRTVMLDVLPAVLPLMASLFVFEMGAAVAVAAVLSFLGFGLGAHQITWGQMIAVGRLAVFEAPWNLLAPVVAIIATVAGCNMAGGGLRRALDVGRRRA